MASRLQPARELGLAARVLPAALGVFLGISLLKFGNPPIMEKWVTAPTNIYEFILGNPWPISWAYSGMCILVFAAAMGLPRERLRMKWHLMLPLVWLGWEIWAGMNSTSKELSHPVLLHLTACVIWFYLGYLILRTHADLVAAWPGMIAGFLLVLAIGWQQHFGGLEQTRKYFEIYLYPLMKEVPPEYIKKLNSTRIFGTLFYPNALAGVILMLLGPVLCVAWFQKRLFTTGARVFIVSAIVIAALGCLYWSGSKGGWLLVMLLGLVWLFQLPLAVKTRRWLVLCVVVLGFSGFILKYVGFFERGATSLSARFDYWAAALKTTSEHPFVGTGPGTFAKAYQKVKKPESEMTRLVHNDYLEQASDSGIPGFLFYAAFFLGMLYLGYPGSPGAKVNAAQDRRPNSQTSHNLPAIHPASDTFAAWLAFLAWLGVFGWALQSLTEFGLYLPALAWPGFALLGSLVRIRERRNEEQVGTA